MERDLSLPDGRLASEVPSGDEQGSLSPVIHQQQVLTAAPLVAWHGRLPPAFQSRGASVHGYTPAALVELI